MVNSVRKGRITEIKFMAMAAEQGYLVSQPLLGDGTYDCIVDVASKLVRVQVKTGFCVHRSYKGKVYSYLEASSSQNIGDRKRRSKYAIGDYDFLAVLSPTKEDFYIIPYNQACNSISIRLARYERYFSNWRFMSL